MATPDVSFIVHSNDTGTTLVFDWIIDSSSGTRITDPSSVSYITLSAYTLTNLDNRKPVQVNYTAQDGTLTAADGTLINTGSIPDLSNGIVYVCGMVVGLNDDDYTQITALDPGVIAKVRGGINLITPAFTAVPGDDTVTVTIAQSTATEFETRMANVTETYPYAGMGAFYVLNPGTDGNRIYNSIPWNDICGNNLSFTVDACNNVPYESWIQLWSAQAFIAGLSQSTAASSNITPTNLPNPPTDIATISTFEYDGGTGTATSVSVLFNTPVGQDSDTTSYLIYRTDLSSNGYTTISSAQKVGTVTLPGSGPYLYDAVDYSFNFTDNGSNYPSDTTLAAPVLGNFYGYQIAGVNSFGTGLLSTPLSGVRYGARCAKPSINLTSSYSGNGSVVLYVDPPTGTTGGFDLTNTYNVFYTTLAGDASGTIQGPSPITISSLTNGVTVYCTAYAITTNDYYTGPYDVSDNLIASEISYNSAASTTEPFTPYTTAPAPLTVSVQPDFSGIIPTGHAYVSWTTTDVSFNNQYTGYSLQRYDASTNLQESSNIILEPSGAPVPLYYLDTDVHEGTTYYYKVSTYYIVPSTSLPVYSVYIRSLNDDYQNYYIPDISNGDVIPFINPSPPTLGQVTFNYDSTVTFSVVPTDNGGLSAITYRARVDVSGNTGLPVFDADVSANTDVTFGPVATNQYLRFNTTSRTLGPNSDGDETATYFSTILSSAPLGPTTAPPFLYNYSVDASGILQIDVSNNGSALNFAEGLIVDSSGLLLVSYSTNPGNASAAYPNATVFNVTQNNTSQAHITVNFNDPDAANSSEVLVVAANSAGAAVYNNI